MILQKSKPGIAFVCSSISWGGLEMNLLRLANWIQDETHKAIVFCPINSPIYKEAQIRNIEVEAIPIQRKYYTPFAAYSLLRRLNNRDIQILVFSHNRDMSMVASVKWLSKGKIATLYQQQMQLGVDKKDFLHTIRINKLDAWIAPLNWLKEQAIQRTRISSEKVHVIPLATDISNWDYSGFSKSKSRKQLMTNDEAYIIGIIGRLDPHKGQELLIRTLPELKKLNPNTELLVIGENTLDNKGDYKQYLIHLSEELGVKDHVNFRPFMKDTRSFFSAIDLFVMATNSETFGMVTTEAMLSKVPIIGSDSGGTSEILENGNLGLLFEPNSTQSLFQKITELMVHPDLAKSISEKAYHSAVQRFSHIDAKRQYLDLFDNLMS